MKAQEIKRILKTAGSITVESISVIATNAGLNFHLTDLNLLDGMVSDGTLEMIPTKGFMLYGLPRPKFSAEELAPLLVEEFGEDDYSINKAAKHLGKRVQELNVLFAELEGLGKVKHIRDGKYMGQPYPIFKNVK